MRFHPDHQLWSRLSAQRRLLSQNLCRELLPVSITGNVKTFQLWQFILVSLSPPDKKKTLHKILPTFYLGDRKLKDTHLWLILNDFIINLLNPAGSGRLLCYSRIREYKWTEIKYLITTYHYHDKKLRNYPNTLKESPWHNIAKLDMDVKVTIMPNLFQLKMCNFISKVVKSEKPSINHATDTEG